MSKYQTGLRRTIAIVLLVISVSAAKGQSPEREQRTLTLNQAEDEFLKNNLSLLSGKYAIENAKAGIITAKLFDNPTVYFENILYNPESKRFFDTTHEGGQYNGNIAQLFKTAGKRNKGIELAKISVQQSGYQFFDLLRTLKYTLRSDFYKIYFQEQSASVYKQEIESLTKTLTVFQLEYKNENISKKEVLRIQSQLYSLQAELSELQDAIDDTQSEFKLLIRANPNTYIIPEVHAGSDEGNYLTNITYNMLLEAATHNRYDLKIAQSAIDYNMVNLKLQHAMAVPDVSVSLTFDKGGSTVRNYSGLGLSIPLPLFNRNQGAIRSAKIAVDDSKLNLSQQQDQVQSDLDNSYQSALRLENLFKGFDPSFKNDFNSLIRQVMINYQKRNIGLLEFLDFYDSYKTNALQFNTLQLNRINALEQLNYVTGTSLFNKTDK
jgi:cobalt-zinc-cadmium efflux system outer membrane protein